MRDLVAFDRVTLLVLAWVPVALTTLEYAFIQVMHRTGRPPAWALDAVAWLRVTFPSVPRDLVPWLWWVSGCVVLLLLVPMALMRFVGGVGPRATGLRVKGTGRDARLYALLFVVFLPVVWLASRRDDFQWTYPFYPRPPKKAGGDWVAFEAAYFVQFLCVEWFFRGFMVLGLKPRLGRASILVMLAPYCMIHFHKPMPEAFGAIGAGLVLGSLSYRTGTIVWGWFLHYGVALTMDLLSLSQSGRL